MSLHLGSLSVPDFARQVYIPATMPDRAPTELLTACRQFSAWAGGPPTASLTDEMLCGWLYSLKLAGWKPATINGKRARLLAVWRCAWRKRAISELPRDVPRLKEPHDPPRARTVGQLSEVLAVCRVLAGDYCGVPRSAWWFSLVLAIFATSERINAIRQCRPSDFDANSRTLRVRGSTRKTPAGRCYRLTVQAAAAIADHLDPTRELIWPWPHCPRYLFTRFRKILLAAGIDASRAGMDLFHSVRRSTLSYTAAFGGLELARQQSGHANVATLIRSYLDPAIVGTTQAADVLPVI